MLFSAIFLMIHKDTHCQSKNKKCYKNIKFQSFREDHTNDCTKLMFTLKNIEFELYFKHTHAKKYMT